MKIKILHLLGTGRYSPLWLRRAFLILIINEIRGKLSKVKNKASGMCS